MKYRRAFLAAVAAFTVSLSSFALEPGVIPPSFPAAQKPAFIKERASLLSEKKTLDSRVARYNRTCGKPKPHEVHKCGVDRQDLYKLLDNYKLRVQDFNKRLAKADKGEDMKKNEAETETQSESPTLGGSLKK